MTPLRARANSAPLPLDARVAGLDWTALAADLDAHGCAVAGPLLSADECAALVACYGADQQFRSRIVMARHGFGRGEYKYFAYPLPEPVVALRAALYPPLAAIANRLERSARHGRALSGRAPRLSRRNVTPPGRRGRRRCCCNTVPATTTACTRTFTASTSFRSRSRSCCREPGSDFAGGEFVLTEQRPRMQSRAEVVPLAQGEGVIFPVHHRPVRGHPRRLPRHHAPRREPPACAADATRSASSSTTRGNRTVRETGWQ